MKLLLGLALALVTVGTSHSSWATAPAAPPPPAVLQDLLGMPVDVTRELGSHDAILLVFWATWCAPCVQELPEIALLDVEYRDRGLRTLAINTGEEHDRVAQFAASRGLTIPILLDAEQSLTRKYAGSSDGSYRIPQEVLVCHRRGVESQGFMSTDALRRAIEECLKPD